MTILGLKTAGFALTVAALVAGCSSSSSSNNAGSDDGGAATGALPTISITTPVANAPVTVMTVSGAEVVPISFTTTGITLMMPGSCANHSDTIDNCGHVHLVIDGAACTPAGMPYNNATPATAAADGAGASPVNAIVSSCPTVNGAHTVSLELHHDDHTPILGADGMVISAQVMLTVSGG